MGCPKWARVARSNWGYAGWVGDRVAIELAGGEAPKEAALLWGYLTGYLR
jgi:hypothetical protein